MKEKSRHSTALSVFEHVSCPSCQPSPALRLANCESDIAISASQAIEGTVITAAAAPGPILERPTGGDHLTAYVRAECVAAIAMHAPLRIEEEESQDPADSQRRTVSIVWLGSGTLDAMAPAKPTGK